MKIRLLIPFSFSLNALNAQMSSSQKQVQIFGGKSFHGTGDMKGISFNTEYQQYFKKKISWSLGLGGTIHDGSFPVFFTDPSGNNIDGSIRYVTAGVQVFSHLGYSILKTNEHQFQIRFGGLIRYQSSSYYDDVTVLYPIATGLPVPVNIFQNSTPQKTFAFGGSGQILYNYTLKGNIVVGILTGIQTDTNGDTITQLSIIIGKKF